MSTVFVSTPNIVHEANCPNNTKTLNEVESKSNVTVCGVKNCPTLLNCPRKLKKILEFNFSKYHLSNRKKIALRGIVTLSARGGRSAEKNLKRLGRYCPRKTCLSKLLVTFVFMTAWAFEARHCPTLLNEIKKTKLDSNTEPQAGINILLPAVGSFSTPFLRHSQMSVNLIVSVGES